MAELIKQEDFSLGQVDRALLNNSSSPLFLSALSEANNVLITAHNKIVRRHSIAKAPRAPSNDVVIRAISFQHEDGNWYTVGAVMSVGGTASNVFIADYARNSEGVLAQNSVFTFPPDAGVEVTDYDFASTGDSVVVVNGVNAPRRLIPDASDISGSTLLPITFAAVPSLDFGDVDYSGYTITPLCSGTTPAPPTGNPPACAANSVFGGVIDITHPTSTTAPFNNDWVGGLVIGRTGASVEQPLGIGIIETVTAMSDTVVRLTVTVIQAFGTQHFSTSGRAWSIRKPVWGPRGDGAIYPSRTAFFKSRLWFANTVEQPMLIAGSTKINPNDFYVGEGGVTDAIVYILQNAESGGIRHLFGSQNLHIFTDTQQLTVKAGLDVGITAGSFSPQVTSSYAVSDLKPIVYRNSVYFATSDGKSIVQIQEDDRQVATSVVSNYHEDLINRPISMAVTTIPGTQDEMLGILNEDGVITFYTRVLATNIQAFTRAEISLFPGNHVALLTTVDNRLTISTNRSYSGYLSDRSDFDFYLSTAINAGVFTVDTSYPVGQAIQVTVRRTGSNRDEFLGEYEVPDTRSINVGDATISGTARYGIGYTAVARSMPLFSSRDGSFLKRRVTQAWCQFYDSFNFTFNGNLVAVLGANPNDFVTSAATSYSVSGTDRIGYSTSYVQDNFLEVRQETPYPMNVQSWAWYIEEKVIV